ncbi:uridine kinase family protein [Streptomyces sp. NRRL WC-3742]|uniref:uridine kinase family protein n=1 Tax=Streptomyces sp. NRRL WC-3742 TaxID=1463934 RepID=UPI0004C501C1|nr:AAA family ATPase [Streptomyces sp. NRRL WC-3742]
MLVTLTGGAGAGKTTLARELAKHGSTTVLHADDYYYADESRGVWAPDENGVPRLDVGDPRSVDEARLATDVRAALGAGVVIVEGLFARRITAPPGIPRLDVFVDLAPDLRLARKIDRKCVQGGFPLHVLLRNYVQHRRAAHDRFVEPLRAGSDLVLDGLRSASELAGQVRGVMAENHGR